MDLLLPLLIVLMGGMIFFSSRQRKKLASQQESLQNSLTVGDVVVMTSGISGTIVDTDDEKTIDLEIAPDVVTTWLRAAVREKIGADALDGIVEDGEDVLGADDDAAARDADGARAGIDPPAAVTTTDDAAEPARRDPTPDADAPTGDTSGGVGAGSSTPGNQRHS